MTIFTPNQMLIFGARRKFMVGELFSAKVALNNQKFYEAS